jgi:hypothetical protein
MSILASDDILIVHDTLTIIGTDASSNNTTGALVVTGGGVGIGENLNIKGTLTTNGTMTLEDTLTMGVGGTTYTFPTEAGLEGQVLKYSTTGALVFEALETLDTLTLTSNGTENTIVKTDGIGKDVQATPVVISAADDISGVNTIDVTSHTTIGGELHLSSVTSSTNNTTGALTVSGGVGIAENLNVAGDVCIDGTVKIQQTLTIGPDGQQYTLPNVTGAEHQLLFLSTGGALIFETPALTPTAVSAPINFGSDNRLVKAGTDRDLEATGITFSDNNDMTGLNTMGVDNGATVGGVLTLTDATSSSNNTTGALIIAGGVGIGENLNVGGDTIINDTLSINDLTESNDTTSGALVVTGGMGVAGNFNVD